MVDCNNFRIDSSVTPGSPGLKPVSRAVQTDSNV